MSESEARRCPKCNEEMETGHLSSAYYWRHGKSRWTTEIGERVFAYKCKNCGYIELYKEMKKKK